MTGGSYMIVFASGDGDAVVGQPFHTNLMLTTDASYLGLVAPDGVTVISDYEYPEQVTNTSYGIASNSNSTTFVNGAGALASAGTWAGGTRVARIAAAASAPPASVSSVAETRRSPRTVLAARGTFR